MAATACSSPQRLTTEALEAAYEYCLEGGCTQFMITLATNSIDKFLRGLEVAREYRNERRKGLAGRPPRRALYQPRQKRRPSRKIHQKTRPRTRSRLLLQKGKDIFRMMTLAPEQCDRACIELLLRSGIVVSAGHSNATYEEAIGGFYQGIPAATHLFNAMSPAAGTPARMRGRHL